MPPPDVNLRELACLAKYGKHNWQANRFTCVRCGANFPMSMSEMLNDNLYSRSPLLDYIKRHGR